MSIQAYKNGKLASYKDGLIQAQSHKILREQVNEALKLFNLSMTEWIILCLLFENKRMRLSELAAILEVESPHVTNLIELVVQKGFVLRVEDASDKRAKLVSITKKGAELLPLVENAVVDKMRRLLKGVEDKDLDIYFKVLSTIISNSKSF